MVVIAKLMELAVRGCDWYLYSVTPLPDVEVIINVIIPHLHSTTSKWSSNHDQINATWCHYDQINATFRSIVVDMVHHRFFKPDVIKDWLSSGIKKYDTDKHSFLTLSFANNNFDAINLDNILPQNSMISKIHPILRSVCLNSNFVYRYSTDTTTKIYTIRSFHRS
jgi:hypothetical protein